MGEKRWGVGVEEGGERERGKVIHNCKQTATVVATKAIVVCVLRDVRDCLRSFHCCTPFFFFVFDDPSTLVFSVVIVPVDGISVAPKCVHFFFVLVVVVVVVVVGL